MKKFTPDEEARIRELFQEHNDYSSVWNIFTKEFNSNIKYPTFRYQLINKFNLKIDKKNKSEQVPTDLSCNENITEEEDETNLDDLTSLIDDDLKSTDMTNIHSLNPEETPDQFQYVQESNTQSIPEEALPSNDEADPNMPSSDNESIDNLSPDNDDYLKNKVEDSNPEEEPVQNITSPQPYVNEFRNHFETINKNIQVLSRNISTLNNKFDDFKKLISPIVEADPRSNTSVVPSSGNIGENIIKTLLDKKSLNINTEISFNSKNDKK